MVMMEMCRPAGKDRVGVDTGEDQMKQRWNRREFAAGRRKLTARRAWNPSAWLLLL